MEVDYKEEESMEVDGEEEEGMEVGEMQRKMMEKIEELTLYIIQLKQEIDELKGE